ncbi:uncharacterized protein MONBRDRAFT_10862 [Monosiga brevicollis MX1]|uniref:C2H2-type domain-containing protein n=1 Tax=Monosiga brevicollis TaxID=81824 RepID=A9V7G3_MONBE|nr:uncharacterized protein MONBRDRAFT_10862 [Monosiga brevicollis MX1]EDQ86508.1 predicted protein [Monosiga brevicollis MX1]|eukprot:XP_001748621.1 hypothetical protein [Monosiga brevicollis MX1]
MPPRATGATSATSRRGRDLAARLDLLKQHMSPGLRFSLSASLDNIAHLDLDLLPSPSSSSSSSSLTAPAPPVAASSSSAAAAPATLPLGATDHESTNASTTSTSQPSVVVGLRQRVRAHLADPGALNRGPPVVFKCPAPNCERVYRTRGGWCRHVSSVHRRQVMAKDAVPSFEKGGQPCTRPRLSWQHYSHSWTPAAPMPAACSDPCAAPSPATSDTDLGYAGSPVSTVSDAPAHASSTPNTSHPATSLADVRHHQRPGNLEDPDHPSPRPIQAHPRKDHPCSARVTGSLASVLPLYPLEDELVLAQCPHCARHLSAQRLVRHLYDCSHASVSTSTSPSNNTPTSTSAHAGTALSKWRLRHRTGPNPSPAASHLRYALPHAMLQHPLSLAATQHNARCLSATSHHTLTEDREDSSDAWDNSSDVDTLERSSTDSGIEGESARELPASPTTTALKPNSTNAGGHHSTTKDSGSGSTNDISIANPPAPSSSKSNVLKAAAASQASVAKAAPSNATASTSGMPILPIPSLAPRTQAKRNSDSTHQSHEPSKSPKKSSTTAPSACPATAKPDAGAQSTPTSRATGPSVAPGKPTGAKATPIPKAPKAARRPAKPRAPRAPRAPRGSGKAKTKGTSSKTSALPPSSAGLTVTAAGTSPYGALPYALPQYCYGVPAGYYTTNSARLCVHAPPSFKYTTPVNGYVRPTTLITSGGATWTYPSPMGLVSPGTVLTPSMAASEVPDLVHVSQLTTFLNRCYAPSYVLPGVPVGTRLVASAPLTATATSSVPVIPTAAVTASSPTKAGAASTIVAAS